MKLLITGLFVCFNFLILAQEQTAAQFQSELNKQYADSLESPLINEDRVKFSGLPFFKINSKFIVVAKFIRTKNEKEFKMKTTTDRKPSYVKYGEVHFKIDDNEHTLAVYQNQKLKDTEDYSDYLFLPFTDATNGTDTYGGGRYLDLKIPEGDEIILDFNKAYNPYCSYNKRYSCPIVPKKNDLPIRIEAGVLYEEKH